jgi:hypothetical protein
MKPEYTEGPEALKNFERGMVALLKVPKSAVLKKKKRAKGPAKVKPDKD